jgi:hypothetical protein
MRSSVVGMLRRDQIMASVDFPPRIARALGVVYGETRYVLQKYEHLGDGNFEILGGFLVETSQVVAVEFGWQWQTRSDMWQHSCLLCRMTANNNSSNIETRDAMHSDVALPFAKKCGCERSRLMAKSEDMPELKQDSAVDWPTAPASGDFTFEMEAFKTPRSMMHTRHN